jgi:hypothetical protein
MEEMSYEELQQRCPTLLSLIEEEIDERRYLVVVDPNVEEEADDADVFDANEYNWMLYFPDRIKEALGEEKFAELYERLEQIEAFEDLIMDDEDLYGVRSPLEDEEALAREILTVLEAMAVEAARERQA